MVTRRTAPAVVPQDVVAAARRLEPSAWEQIFDLHYPRLYRMFRARTSERAEAEELAAATLRSCLGGVVGHHRRGGQDQPFETWLFKVARCELISFARTRPEADVMHRAVRDEFVAPSIRAILDSLQPDHRQALALRHVVGLSRAEAAAVMGQPEEAFTAMLSDARADFRRVARATGWHARS
ncbi:MAG: sigma-70 family RNA polymerase sigma factor [Dehalococcoidia bacterium]